MSTKGRPQLPIISENFTAIEQVQNRSNRKWWKCNHCPEGSKGSRIEGRDNNLLSHLSDSRKCPGCPADQRKLALNALVAKGQVSIDAVPLPDADDASANAPVPQKRRKRDGPTLPGQFFDRAMSEVQVERANVKLFRYIVHANISFRSAADWYFHDFVDELRPSYTLPSPYVLSHTLLDSEYARAHIEDVTRLSSTENLTFLFDGWEDALKRSLYGSVAAKVNSFPIVLSLDDLTGKRGNVATLLETTERALVGMELGTGEKFIACTTDSPTAMRAFRRALQQKFWWILLFGCFMHDLNTIIGEIAAYPRMKALIKKATEVVTFFNRSHYWGGQLKIEAAREGVKGSLKQNCESRFYALVVHCASVEAYRSPLSQTCIRPDAERAIAGLSPVAQAVRDTVLQRRDPSFWSQLRQFVKVVKCLVDAIGNIESRQATLADCMLELIRCARAMSRLTLDEDEDVGFWTHAKSVFNRRFHSMNTQNHSLALYLHPLCRKLAVSQVANGRSFQAMVTAALDIAKQWRWAEADAHALLADLELYQQCRAPFTGGTSDALKWWQNLSISGEKHPLKRLAIALHSIVPHAGDVERLFSDLGGTQSVKRCNLSVDTFEKLGKLRSNYSYHLHQKAEQEGRSTHRKHAHMHTRENGGINIELATDLEADFAWVPPLPSLAPDPIEGPESVSIDELERAFDNLAREVAEREKDEPASDSGEVLKGQVYDFAELDKVDQGTVPTSLEDDTRAVTDVNAPATAASWDPNALMAAKGITNL